MTAEEIDELLVDGRRRRARHARARHRDELRRDRGGAGDGRQRRACRASSLARSSCTPTFGGVVPEIASRAHLELLNPVIARAIVEAGVDDRRIDAVACTIGPGLIGALLVGVSAAKALALAWDVPFVGVNHLEAHLYAALLDDPSIEFPLVVLLVSGGHTMLVEMLEPRPLPAARPDDRRRGRRGVRQGRPLPRPRLPGRPGDRAGGPATATRRRSRSRGRCATTGLDFSFCGLKTSVMNYVRKHPDVDTADVAASFQAAVVDVLVHKARRAAAEVGAKGLALGGGVAANSLLREDLLDACVGGRPARLPAQPGDVHRQRGDDRRRRLAPPPPRRPDPTRRRRVPQPPADLVASLAPRTPLTRRCLVAAKGPAASRPRLGLTRHARCGRGPKRSLPRSPRRTAR